MTRTTSTDPITVTRTPLGVTLSGPSRVPTGNSQDNTEAEGTFSLTLTTRKDVDTFLARLRYPDNPEHWGDYDAWLGILEVNDEPPVEPHIGVFLDLDWPTSPRSTITCEIRLLMWADFGINAAVAITLDDAAVRRLHDAVTASVDDRLPTRATLDDAIDRGPKHARRSRPLDSKQEHRQRMPLLTPPLGVSITNLRKEERNDLQHQSTPPDRHSEGLRHCHHGPSRHGRPPGRAP